MHRTEGPLEWSRWKHGELVAAREAEEERQAKARLWQSKQVDALLTWRAEQRHHADHMNDYAKASARESKRHAQALHRWLSRKASDDLKRYIDIRREELKRGEELHRERCGGFAIAGDLTVR